MAKIYERILSTNILREKRRDSFDPKNVRNSVRRGQYLYGYLAGNTASESFFFFFDYIIDLLWLFQKRSFVLSSKHENQNVATIGTLLDQFMSSCK